MASTTRTAADLVNNGTTLGDGKGERTDALHTINVVTSVLVISLLVPMMLMRIYIKRYIVGSYGREDSYDFVTSVDELSLTEICDLGVCLIAWFMTTAYCVSGLLMSRHGGGNHEWEVSPSELIAFQKTLYADAIIYGPAAFLTKTTLLLIFTRVFAHARRAVLFVYVFIGIMACYYIPVLILKIRMCTPIEGLWDPSADTKCFNQQSIFFTDAIVSVVTDVVVLLLPLPLVYTLKVSTCKKLRIAALLGAGGIATIASVCRAIFVWSPTAYDDLTVSFVRINLLGIAEVGIGITCACVPTFNILFTRYAKEHQSAKSRSTTTGERSLKLKMRPLTGDGKEVEVWRMGHTSVKSFGSGTDEVVGESAEGGLVGGGLRIWEWRVGRGWIGMLRVRQGGRR
ncbi:hypothetical protein BKA65DRAFT_568289 [Rhexocercosporidium sp. MPI-PUGE-AT-0058]|nr:hypothetical protein BKA65DRAFT_568289 [Rhexocercosporidium sp. MPI-PUGE-AT-0058]